MMLALMMLVAGCGTNKVQDTKESSQPQVGIVDMAKAVKSHPKYNQLMALEQEIRSLSAQEQARQAALAQKNQEAMAWPDTSQNDLAELNKGLQQEFTEAMSVKEQEINARLAAKEKAIHDTLSGDFKTYAEKVDQEYQPQIFNLQLKLKTVQLSKEEAASLQEQLEALQSQHADKIAEKQKELTAQMTEKMAPDKAAAAQELESYSKQVNERLGKKAAAKQEEITARNAGRQTALLGNVQAASDTGGQQLMMKQQELRAMQDFILQNIKDKAGKVAVESGLEVVLANVAVNVNGIDITAAVITECNKQ